MTNQEREAIIQTACGQVGKLLEQMTGFYESKTGWRGFMHSDSAEEGLMCDRMWKISFTSVDGSRDTEDYIFYNAPTDKEGLPKGDVGKPRFSIYPEAGAITSADSIEGLRKALIKEYKYLEPANPTAKERRELSKKLPEYFRPVGEEKEM